MKLSSKLADIIRLNMDSIASGISNIAYINNIDNAFLYKNLFNSGGSQAIATLSDDDLRIWAIFIAGENTDASNNMGIGVRLDADAGVSSDQSLCRIYCKADDVFTYWFTPAKPISISEDGVFEINQSGSSSFEMYIEVWGELL